MGKKFIVNARHLPIWIVVVTGLLVAFLVWSHVSSVQSHAVTQITDLSARSEDGAIVLRWAPLTDCRNKYIEIRISKDGESHCIEIPASNYSYTYMNGEHGKLYEFSVDVKGEQLPQTQTAMFLNYAQLPELPMITIETVTGEDPTCEMLNAPAGAWGATAVNNEWVSMKIAIQKETKTVLKNIGEIKIRGNTSAFSTKKPYKLKLNHEMDLLCQEQYYHTDWVLISAASNLCTEVSWEIASMCGVLNQPRYMPVNLMMNGDWKGLYLLMESVDVGSQRIPVKSNGFIIENNAYWWDEDGIYFQTQHQDSHMGYTFVYPQVANIEQENAQHIIQYMQSAENAIMIEGESYLNYIEIDSAAAWLLTHDLMGTWDAGGSNMYLYITDMRSSKLNMGPIWDMDSSYNRVSKWAWIHEWSFGPLLQKEEFRKTYIQKWNVLSNVLCEQVNNFLDGYMQQYGNSLQESWNLDCERWQSEPISVEDSVNSTNKWFAERKVWLDQAMQGI